VHGDRPWLDQQVKRVPAAVSGRDLACRHNKVSQAMIKDIVVNLSVGKPRDVAGDFAISLASAFEAHLSGIAFAYEPVVGGMLMSAPDAGFLEAFRAENRRAANDATRAFDEAARRAGIPSGSQAIAATADGAAQRFGEIAREYDLSVLAQAEPDGDVAESLAIEAALFNSGRPVLVVPYIQSSGLKLDRVMVCWDGSRNAARAVADAMPMLLRAGRVEVVTIESRERRNELVGAKIAEHLARHGLKVELKPIIGVDTDVAASILSHAADNAADLIVMGGYGHSRLREFVLGGATDGMLRAMTVPTLMAH
jgi:nucleotide-binding universal stress UspA family protein